MYFCYDMEILLRLTAAMETQRASGCIIVICESTVLHNAKQASGRLRFVILV